MRARMPATNDSRLALAQDLTRRFLAEAEPERDVTVWSFGGEGTASREGRRESCVPGRPIHATDADRGVISAAVNALAPRGWTPLALTLDAIRQAYPHGPLDVIVLTDGQDTCDGDAITAGRALLEGSAPRRLRLLTISADADEMAALERLMAATNADLLPIDPERAARLTLTAALEGHRRTP